MTDDPPDDGWLPDAPEAAGNVVRLRESVASAPEAAPAEGEGEGGKPPRKPPKKGGRPTGEIWEGCPVTPLGVNGAVSYLLDVHGQLRAVAKVDGTTIMHLFGREGPQLAGHFPQYNKDGSIKRGRFDVYNATAAIIQACSERGLFDPEGAVRGVGAWTDDDGALVYHMGDAILVAGERREATAHQGRIYPAYPPIPHPAGPAGRPDPVPDLLETLSSWQWARPELDPMVALGMVCAQMLGGALDWRPVYWITGGAAAGKSTLQTLVRHLHGDRGLIQSTDTTKSGITSQIGQSSLPVAVDELEPGDEGSTKERDIIQLARVAASGGRWFRGSADQRGVGGNVYSTFLFSSILIPGALKPQDLSRMIILSLGAFPEGTRPLSLRADTWRKRGAALKSTLIDRWPLWAARIELWRAALEAERVTGRAADNWATTLGLADLAQREEEPEAELLAEWARKVARVVGQEAAEAPTDADAMLLHLLTQSYDIYRRGEHHTVAQWVMAAARLPGAPQGLISEAVSDGRAYAAACNAKLAKAGLRVVGEGQAARLFLANAAIQGLKDLFARSQWAGGAWSQSAARVPGAEPSPHPLTLAGVRSRGWLLPFVAIPGLSYLPMDRDEGGAAAAAAPYSGEDFA